MLKDEVHACLLVRVVYCVACVPVFCQWRTKNVYLAVTVLQPLHVLYSSLRGPPGMLGLQVTDCICCRKAGTEYSCNTTSYNYSCNITNSCNTNITQAPLLLFWISVLFSDQQNNCTCDCL